MRESGEEAGPSFLLRLLLLLPVISFFFLPAASQPAAAVLLVHEMLKCENSDHGVVAKTRPATTV